MGPTRAAAERTTQLSVSSWSHSSGTGTPTGPDQWLLDGVDVRAATAFTPYFLATFFVDACGAQRASRSGEPAAVRHAPPAREPWVLADDCAADDWEHGRGDHCLKEYPTSQLVPPQNIEEIVGTSRRATAVGSQQAGELVGACGLAPVVRPHSCRCCCGDGGRAGGQ